MSMVVVTGAAGGLGRAMCRRLGRDGATVVAVDLADSLADAVLELEEAGVSALPVQVDLTTEEGVAAVAEAVDGSVRTLVNNAGITRDARLVNMTDEQFDAVLEVNLGAAYRLTRALIPVLDDDSTIVNIASRAYLGNFGQFNYAMSKGALVGMTRALALELAPRTRVNAIAPGLIGTEMAMAIPDEIREKMVAAIPMGRMGRPDDVADLVAFLADRESAYITGYVHVIGGGRSLS
jgi:NAD(P)-dependent dehydrogenase (short-subunit alcohol dehydrogenase family)